MRRIATWLALASALLPALAQVSAQVSAPPTAPAPASIADKAELERTPIVGNRELPKVLLFVPWKQPLPGVPSGRPVNSVLDDSLLLPDPASFRRQIAYEAAARSAAATNTPSPTPNAQTAGATR